MQKKCKYNGHCRETTIEAREIVKISAETAGDIRRANKWLNASVSTISSDLERLCRYSDSVPLLPGIDEGW
jgi:hypothetical protein